MRKGGIHFTLVGTTCRIEVWLKRTQDIRWVAWITRGHSRNLMSGSRPRGADVSGDSLLPFVEAAVTPGSVVHTDGWNGYNGIPGLGYDHRPRSISASGNPAHIVMPRVHRVAALLDRWWLGTHQGAISGRHLDYYLDEYTFRYNRRGSRARGMLFYRLLQQSVHVDPVPYKRLIGGKKPDCPNI